MKVLGIIVEYNPFHNGHLYHLSESKRLSSADYTVCVMSGNFIQRGEPAIVNKWARAEMALMGGADLVIELPVVYAMSSAEYFAFGAVKILDSMGIVDCISFGSESGKIEELDYIAQILHNEPQKYKEFLKHELDKGISYPTAREKALESFLKQSGGQINIEIASSNNILGIEYLKALKRLGSSIVPITIPRINNSYNEEELTGSVSSATSIRRHIGKGFSGLGISMPKTSCSILKREFEAGRGPVFPKDFECILLSLLRKMETSKIKELPYVSEGLENRIKEASSKSGSFQKLLDLIATKRYTKTRIQRSLFHVLTGLSSREFELFNRFGSPQYIRVLGFNQNGRKLLSESKKKAILPLITKASDFKNSCNPLLRRMLQIESDSTDMYVLAYKNPDQKQSGQEYTQNIIRI